MYEVHPSPRETMFSLLTGGRNSAKSQMLFLWYTVGNSPPRVYRVSRTPLQLGHRERVSKGHAFLHRMQTSDSNRLDNGPAASYMLLRFAFAIPIVSIMEAIMGFLSRIPIGR